MRQEVIAERLWAILRDIQIPDKILEQLTAALAQEKNRETVLVRSQQEHLQQRLTSTRRRMEQLYVDKVDGKVGEDFWSRKTAEWQTEEQQILAALHTLEVPQTERLLDVTRILELANKAYSLYLRQNPFEQAELLRIILSNCSIDGANLYPVPSIENLSI